MGDYIASLGRHIPIDGVVIRDGASRLFGRKELDPLAAFKREATDALDEAFKYLHFKPYVAKTLYPENTTLASVSLDIQASEAAVLMFDDWFDSITFETGALKSFLSPALSHLTFVRSGMEEALKRGTFPTGTDKMELTASKVEWLSRLSLSKALVSAGVETPVFLANTPQSARRINDEFAISGEYFVALQQAIISRTLDENEEPIPNEADQIIDIANKHLKNFVLGPIALFNPHSRRTAISSLRSIQVLLREMIRKDRLELHAAQNFTRSVEANPLFASVLKPAWDEFMRTLRGAPLAGDLPRYLNKGNLSTLVAALRAGRFVYDEVKSYLECRRSDMSEEDERNIDHLASIIGGDSGEAKRIARQAEASVNRLRNEQILLNLILAD